MLCSIISWQENKMDIISRKWFPSRTWSGGWLKREACFLWRPKTTKSCLRWQDDFSVMLTCASIKIRIWWCTDNKSKIDAWMVNALINLWFLSLTHSLDNFERYIDLHSNTVTSNNCQSMLVKHAKENTPKCQETLWWRQKSMSSCFRKQTLLSPS